MFVWFHNSIIVCQSTCQTADHLSITARRYVLVSVTRRQHRAASWYPAPAGPINCHGARRVWRGFWHPGTNFCEDYACRGTNYLEDRELSRCMILIAGRCACPGATTIANLSWVQELSKTVTSLLNIPSVLAVALILLPRQQEVF